MWCFSPLMLLLLCCPSIMFTEIVTFKSDECAYTHKHTQCSSGSGCAWWKLKSRAAVHHVALESDQWQQRLWSLVNAVPVASLDHLTITTQTTSVVCVSSGPLGPLSSVGLHLATSTSAALVWFWVVGFVFISLFDGDLDVTGRVVVVVAVTHNPDTHVFLFFGRKEILFIVSDRALWYNQPCHCVAVMPILMWHAVFIFAWKLHWHKALPRWGRLCFALVCSVKKRGGRNPQGEPSR